MMLNADVKKPTICHGCERHFRVRSTTAIMRVNVITKTLERDGKNEGSTYGDDGRRSQYTDHFRKKILSEAMETEVALLEGRIRMTHGSFCVRCVDERCGEEKGTYFDRQSQTCTKEFI